MLLTLMMLPLPLAAIPGANAATRKNAARTLLANSASNVSTLRSAVAPNQENPALLTRTSISPTASTRRWRSAGSLRSAPTKRARPPAAVTDSTVAGPRDHVQALEWDIRAGALVPAEAVGRLVESLERRVDLFEFAGQA